MRFLAIATMALALSLSLSACSDMTPEEVAATDGASCTSYGFKEGTDAFAECRMRLAQERSADDRAMAVAFASRPMPVYQAPPPLEIYQPPPRVRMNCTSTGFGNMVNTNCY